MDKINQLMNYIQCRLEWRRLDMGFPFLHMEKMEVKPASHKHPKHTDPTCFLQSTAFSQSVDNNNKQNNKLIK